MKKAEVKKSRWTVLLINANMLLREKCTGNAQLMPIHAGKYALEGSRILKILREMSREYVLENYSVTQE
jgi:hypothetical protein